MGVSIIHKGLHTKLPECKFKETKSALQTFSTSFLSYPGPFLVYSDNTPLNSHLIPCTIFISLVVTSLLLLYLSKIEEGSKLLASLHLVLKMQQQSELTQSLYYSQFTSKGDAVNGRRFYEEQ